MTNTDTKKYRLLKDYVTPKFTFEKGTPVAYGGGRYMVGVEQYTEEELIEKREWFELIPEQSKSIPNKQDERIEVKKIEYLAENITGKKHIDIRLTGDVSEDKFPAIKQAIEAVLNQPSTTPIEDKGWEIGDEAKLWAALDILSRIWYYGGFKIETANERTLAGIMNDLGLFPTTEEKILMRPGYDEYNKKYLSFSIDSIPSNPQDKGNVLFTKEQIINKINEL